MTWTVPRTWTAGEIATASLLNLHVRDNLSALVPQRAFITTSETTTSTTYANLATVGPSATVNTLSEAIVITSSFMTNATTGQWAVMSHAVEGATTIAASDAWQITFLPDSATYNLYTSRVYRRTDLTTGSNTFKAKYRVTGGTGSFAEREIIVIPVGPSV